MQKNPVPAGPKVGLGCPKVLVEVVVPPNVPPELDGFYKTVGVGWVDDVNTLELPPGVDVQLAIFLNIGFACGSCCIVSPQLWMGISCIWTGPLALRQ